MAAAAWRAEAQPWRLQGGAPRAVGWAIAAALVARTRTLQTLGPFDPEAFLHSRTSTSACAPPRAGCRRSSTREWSWSTSAATARAARPAGLDAETRRRRAVVGERLGAAALRRDDAAQALTFLTRGARPRDARARAQLRALLRARRG